MESDAIVAHIADYHVLHLDVGVVLKEQAVPGRGSNYCFEHPRVPCIVHRDRDRPRVLYMGALDQRLVLSVEHQGRATGLSAAAVVGRMSCISHMNIQEPL